MRKVWLNREDFELFHTDITPFDYEFFRTHNGAFKRMWQEQRRQFWSVFVSTFEYFIWNYGILKDFPMKAEEIHEYVDEILYYIRDQFVDGKVSSAKALVMDCVTVTQNRQCIALLDKISYSQNPFYMKETREVFRNLFGPPNSKRSFMKVLCGLPVYIKFAGAAVMLLRRWLDAPDVPSDDESISRFYRDIHIKKSNPTIPYEALLALKARSLMPRPALEAPPLSASMGKKDSKDAVDTPGHSKKSVSDTSQKSKKSKSKSKAQSEEVTAPKTKTTTDEQTGKDTESQKEEQLAEGVKGQLDTADAPHDDQKGSESGDKDSVAVAVAAGDPGNPGDPGNQTEGSGAGEEAPVKKKKKKRKRRKKKAAAVVEEEDVLGLDEEVLEERKAGILGLDRDLLVATDATEWGEDSVVDITVVTEGREDEVVSVPVVTEVTGVPVVTEVTDVPVVTKVTEGREDKVIDVPEAIEGREDEEVGVPVVTTEGRGDEVPSVPVVTTEGRGDEVPSVPAVTEGRGDEVVDVMKVREDMVVGAPVTEVMEGRDDKVPEVTEGRGDEVVDVMKVREDMVVGAPVTEVMEGRDDKVPEVTEGREDEVTDVPVVTEGREDEVTDVPVVTEGREDKVVDVPEEKEEGFVENVLGLDEDVPLLPEEGKGEEMADEVARCSEVRPALDGLPSQTAGEVPAEGDAPELLPEVGEARQEEGGEEQWAPSGEEEAEGAAGLEEEAAEDGKQSESGELKSDVESSGESEKKEFVNGLQPMIPEVQTELNAESSEKVIENENQPGSAEVTAESDTGTERSGELEEKESESVEATAESGVEQAADVADESEQCSESPEAEFDVVERSSQLEQQSAEVETELDMEVCEKAVAGSRETEKEVQNEQQPETPPPTVNPVDEEVKPVAKQDEVVAKVSSDREEGLDSGKRRLHACAFCDTKETSAKSFKRCQKCRGKTNPRYYCSRECQAKHWKTHKLDHKTVVVKTAEN